MKFLIQTIDGQIKHDFSFTLIESCAYQNWMRKENAFTYVLSDITIPEPSVIPVGSVEFVCEYLFNHFSLTPYPKNIPIELMDKCWTGRNVINGTNRDIKGMRFVKSATRIKSFTEICDSAPLGSYQISDIIEIESEWRAFIYEGKLVGLQNYSGEFDVFPDAPKIKAMIKAYKSQPVAYTLDVAVNKDGTFIIEVHDFFSCGLYGFAEHKILPYMFSKWFYSFIRN